MDLPEYYVEFMQDIYARSGTQGDSCISTFTERMCELLEEQGVIEDFRSIGYKKTARGIRVDACELNHETEVLSLFVTDFRFENNLGTLSQTDVTKLFKRGEKFFTASLNPRFHQSLEESASGYELAREIFENSSEISRIRIFLLSNAELSKRVESVKARDVDGHHCSYDIWDISRVFRLEASGKAREDIIVGFEDYNEAGIPCLPAFTGSTGCESYLMVMPGRLIADLYDKYGERLLEQNVRTFLQFRGKVNKGIRNTIMNDPGMFFAYNNGLCVTAESVETNEHRDRIKSITNLQIVNGGQTTASIFTAMKKSRADLSDVYIQVKLSLVPPEQVETVVPKISEYANTQNKVSASDFFSNHPFHIRIEEISRRLWAPSPEGGLRETHWFYERARGQYANAQANLTPAKQKEFLSKFPRYQMFTKTDLAKFEHCMDMLPHVVSLHAQKNFARFADGVSRKWEKDETQFNELYFKQLIAKAILFRYLDKNTMKQDWYGGDYKFQIVAYSLAKVAQMVADTGKYLDLSRIWQEQGLSPALKAQLLSIAESMNNEILETPEGITNVGEWCKKELCWYQVKRLQLTLSQELLDELIDTEELRDRQKDAARIQVVDTGINKQTYVVEKGADYWQAICQWNRGVQVLSPTETDILNVACQMPDKIPSDKQSQVLMSIERKAVDEGFPAG